MSNAQDASRYRLAHTMLRVRDLEAPLELYTRFLGMEVLRSADYPDGKITNTFIGYGPEATHTTIELTYNWDQREPYDKGNGWGHPAIEVPDVYQACERLAAEGVNVVRPPGPMKHGTRNLAFIEDPDGYNIELNESLV